MENTNNCNENICGDKKEETASCDNYPIYPRCFWYPKSRWGKVFLAVIVFLLVIKILGGGCNQCDTNNPVNVITVSGLGEVMVKPDIVKVSFGVTAEDLDVSKAQTESATKINKIIDFLKTQGVEEKDIKTINYNIYPRYDYNRVSVSYPYSGKQVLAAYVVSQNVEVKIKINEIDNVGAILTGMGEFGVTDISDLTFTVDNQETVKDQARTLAITDAKDQAKVLAKELGVRLVKITNFSENDSYPRYYGLEKSSVMGMGSADSIAPQITTGESKITSTVNITYEIR